MSATYHQTSIRSAYLAQSKYASKDAWHLQFRAASDGSEVSVHLADPELVAAIKKTDGRAFVTLRGTDDRTLEITPDLTRLSF